MDVVKMDLLHWIKIYSRVFFGTFFIFSFGWAEKLTKIARNLKFGISQVDFETFLLLDSPNNKPMMIIQPADLMPMTNEMGVVRLKIQIVKHPL